jgi:hypothetical protein
MTTFIEDIRKLIYFECQGFTVIYECFCYYATRELGNAATKGMSAINQVDQMGLTQTSWDIKIMKQE